MRLHSPFQRDTVGFGWSFQSPFLPQWQGSGAPRWPKAGLLCKERWEGCVAPPAWTVSSTQPGIEPGYPHPDHNRGGNSKTTSAKLHHNLKFSFGNDVLYSAMANFSIAPVWAVSSPIICDNKQGGNYHWVFPSENLTIFLAFSLPQHWQDGIITRARPQALTLTVFDIWWRLEELGFLIVRIRSSNWTRINVVTLDKHIKMMNVSLYRSYRAPQLYISVWPFFWWLESINEGFAPLNLTFSVSVPFMVMAVLTKSIISSSSRSSWYLSCSRLMPCSRSFLAPKVREAVFNLSSSQRPCSPPCSMGISSSSRSFWGTSWQQTKWNCIRWNTPRCCFSRSSQQTFPTLSCANVKKM